MADAEIRRLVAMESLRAHVSPALVTAMIQIGLHGDPSAVSQSGAGPVSCS